MTQRNDFLVEIFTEELPPKALLSLAEAFYQQIQTRLQAALLDFTSAQFFATPRRIAVLVRDVVAATPDQVVERKGPAFSAAFDAEGNATPACAGFARSCGVTPDKLQRISTPQGEWMAYTQAVPGQAATTLLPAIVEQAALALPTPKRMRWGSGETQFVRPVQAVMMLYGDQVVSGTILNCAADRRTRGHRFHAQDWLALSRASDYAEVLEAKGQVMADFAKRRAYIQAEADACVQRQLGDEAKVFISSEALLNEVTGLVEWPVALCGQFDANFLALPREVLISAMQDHQRYFPVIDRHDALLPYFVTISNIVSNDPARVKHGNERVLRARLADAAFFYETDKKESLAARLERLKGIVYQAKLGTLHDKAERLSHLTHFIATQLKADEKSAKRAGLLALTDLTTSMVNEFPELQGVMGGYYARHDGEPEMVANAIAEQYLPRFAGDRLPLTALGQALAIASRLDALVGAFGMNQIPTGDKDPFGLRRAALGVLRIMIENKLNLDLKDMLAFAAKTYTVALTNHEVVPQVLSFMQERLRAWYQDQGVTPDVFAAVAALAITNPLDADARIKAVQAFKQLQEAEALCVANKRVSNILAKYSDALEAKAISPQFFENAAESALAAQLETKSQVVMRFYELRQYDQVLLQLADLRQPVDDFFAEVMVMTDDKPRRENRILLLAKLRALFLQVADIALLQ